MFGQVLVVPICGGRLKDSEVFDMVAPLTASIARLGKKVYNLVNFTRFPVNASGWPDPNGTYIPSGFSPSGQAGAAYPPGRDGLYHGKF